MRRVDLIHAEKHIAETYRREATNRRSRNPRLADRLLSWAEASERRVAEMKFGPLFGSEESK